MMTRLTQCTRFARRWATALFPMRSCRTIPSTTVAIAAALATTAAAVAITTSTTSAAITTAAITTGVIQLSSLP